MPALNDAREAYSSDLAALLNATCRELSRPVEHFEIATAGVWLRSEMTTSTHARSQARRLAETALLQDQIASGVPVALRSVQGASGMPVVVVTDPHDSLASVLNQMTTFDTLWIVYAADDDQLRWVALCGPEADDVPLTAATVDANKVAGMPIATFAAEYSTAGNQHVRLIDSDQR